MREKKWNLENRKVLEKYLKEGFSVPAISKIFKTSSIVIYKEIKNGVTEEEYENRQYVKYSANAAIENLLAAYKKKITEGE